jgi:gas vesicle protein
VRLDLKRIALLLLTALVLAPIPIQAETQVRRHIHVADGGLVFVTDTLPAPSQTSQIALGFPLDMQDNLAGYYVLGADAVLEKRVEGGLLWLYASPRDGWPSGEVSVVTVWRKLLTNLGEESRYQLVLPSNPILNQKIETIQITLTSDGNPSITSVRGVGLEISSDKRRAEGRVDNVDKGEFKTLTAFIENPDLTIAVVVKANVEADLQNYVVTAKILYQNEGGKPVSSVDLILGKDVEVMSASSGLFKLGQTWNSEKGILSLNLPETLPSGRRIEIKLVYRDKAAAVKNGDGFSVKLPRLVNTTVAEYLITVSTPPVSELKYREEPWSLRLLENGRRQVTFRYTNIYPTGREAVWVGFTAAATAPIPLILLAAIVVVAAVNAVVVRPRKGERREVDKQQMQRLRQAVEKLIADVVGNIDVFASVEKPGKAVRPVDEQLKGVRDALAEAKRLYRLPEQVGRLNNLERVLTELNATAQALARSAEDFKAGRLPKSVYRKLYGEYRRECLKLADQAYEVLDEFTR